MLTTQTIYRLMFETHKKKVYPSFPMSHVMDLPDTLAEIDKFRATINEHFIAFDPGDVDEFVLHTTAQKASAEGKETIEVQAADGPVTLKTAEVEQISGDIMGQIYMRDFKMVDQSDMIVSYVRELPNGKPGLSQRRRARTASRLRRRQRGLRRLGVQGNPVAVHHRDGDEGVQEHGGGDRVLQAEGVCEMSCPGAEAARLARG